MAGNEGCGEARGWRLARAADANGVGCSTPHAPRPFTPPPHPRYEREGRLRKSIPAQKLWFAILEAQVETGNPYMLFKDACNAKSNQQNLGTIKCSNLCTEIVEFTSPEETAVCNLASIALPRCAHARPLRCSAQPQPGGPAAHLTHSPAG